MSYIYLIEESMTKQFFQGGIVTINGCFTSKKAAIEALKSSIIFYKKENVEKHKTCIYWKPDNILAHRYYRIVKVEANLYQKPGLCEIVQGEEIVIFPESKN